MRSTCAALVFLLVGPISLAALVACAGEEAPVSTTGPAPRDTAAALAGFAVVGDPTSMSGATWTYRATAGGIAYDLEGVLRKPAGNGPFPAVIISHGLGGSA